jgi:predicted lipoprotein with Yx(FWY)xxD motif
MTNRASAYVVAALLALPLLAGCGSSSSKSSSSSTAAGGGTSSTSSGTSSGSSTQQGAGPETVKTASTGVGTILVDGEGKTIYLFQKDRGPQSTCSGACLAHWPAVTTTGKPQAGSGVTASMLSTSKRSDGTTQVTYAGHPLYYFSGDSSAGAMSGQGVAAFGADWYVLGPNGKKVEGHGTSSSGGSSSSGSSTSSKGGY